MAWTDPPDPPDRGPGERAARPAVALPITRPLLALAGIALVAACLFFARAVLVPLALAILLTFLLSPVVGVLQRRLGRVGAVMVAVVLAFSVLGAVGWGLFYQLTSLANELPQYRDNIRQKISDLRGASRGGALEKVQETVKDVAEEIENQAPPPRSGRRPQPVVVQRDAQTGLLALPTTLGPLLEQLAAVGLVIALTIFMLYERQALRNRLLRLFGYGRLTVTTKALDEAGERITRYLLMQGLVNAIYGVAIGTGLFFIGLPYALLWGFLAGAVRFIPYVGPWVGALLPITLALAVFSGWRQPLLVAGLFVVAELFTNMILETILWAGSAGVSSTALLVAVAFWTWLWGPIGLILATPLTVCLVVVGKYVPELDFLTVLMTDEPVLSPGARFYQRLVAMDPDEAAEILEQHRAQGSLEDTCREVLLPALTCLKRDRAAGRLSAGDEAGILRAFRSLLADIEPEAEEVPAAATVDVLAVPSADEVDELAVRVVRDFVAPARCTMALAPRELLTAEVVDLVAGRQPAIVLIGAVSPGGLAHVRFLVKRLRARFPGLRIAVGRWGRPEEAGADGEVLRRAGADEVSTSAAETRDHLGRLAQLCQAGPPAVPRGESAA